jgi:hypothetical protein
LRARLRPCSKRSPSTRTKSTNPCTVIIYPNGFIQNPIPLEQQQHAKVYLPYATPEQLQAVRRLSGLVVKINPVVRFRFKAGTPPLLELMRELRNA